MVEVGKCYSCDELTLHRSSNIDLTGTIAESNEYVFVNRNTGKVMSWQVQPDGTPHPNANVHGISCMALKDSQGQSRHGVFQTALIGKGCFLTTDLSPNLASYVFEIMKSRGGTKKKAKDYHVLVFPTVELTVDEFISEFFNCGLRSWMICNFCAEGCTDDCVDITDGDDDKDTVVVPDYEIDKFSDRQTSQLSRVLHYFITSYDELIISTYAETLFEKLSEEGLRFQDILCCEELAMHVYYVLTMLEKIFERGNIVSALCHVSSLKDSLDEVYCIEENWEVVNISSKIAQQFYERFASEIHQQVLFK
jgi:hypothetical protein